MSDFSRRDLMARSSFGVLSALCLPQWILSACGSDSKHDQRDSQAKRSNREQSDSNTYQRSPQQQQASQQPATAMPNQTSNYSNQPSNYPTGNSGMQNPPVEDSTMPDPGAKTGQNVLAAGIVGASPSGFFSYGAPELTAEQIKAGQEIQANCEGGNHTLLITAEHLATLAKGETVAIDSSQNTHFGNPTNHKHAITYTPKKA